MNTNRIYGHQELALLYFPNVLPSSASTQLTRFIRRDPELLQPRRQRRQRHIVRRDHKLQSRQPLQRLGKELCPVGDELAAGIPI